MRAGLVGWTRLSKPPQLAPMPNRSSASISADTASWEQTQMVAAFEAGLQRRGDRRQPRRHQHRAIAALDPGQRLFESEGGRRAEQTIADDVEALLRIALLRLTLRRRFALSLCGGGSMIAPGCALAGRRR
jgi:hypothetical protein